MMRSDLVPHINAAGGNTPGIEINPAGCKVKGTVGKHISRHQ
jgi:hypothetical protein